MRKYVVILFACLAVLWFTLCASGSYHDCGPCEEPNDPALVAHGADPCIPKDPPPHPDPGDECWVYNEDICEWLYTPGDKPEGCYQLVNCEWVPKEEPPKPDGCYEFDEATCEWVPKEEPSKPDGCYEFDAAACEWVPKDEPPKPDGCYEFDEATCEWVPKEEPSKPDGCYEFDAAACEWVPTEEPPHPNPRWPCWEFDANACEWFEKDPGPKPGRCYRINLNCEWEDMPMNCWNLETVPPGPTGGCPECSAAGCGHAVVRTYPYQIPVQDCMGSASVSRQGWARVTLVAVLRPCRLIPDYEAIANAFSELVECCEQNPIQCGASALAAILTVKAGIASGLTVAAAIAALGPDTVADMLETICSCIPCSPCDLVTCEISYRYGLARHVTQPKYKLTGECP
jgi:hypothetical protein